MAWVGMTVDLMTHDLALLTSVLFYPSFYLHRLRAQRRLSSTKIREARDRRKLETAQAHIDTMIGPLPTCTSSNRIRQEAGTCSQPEEYIAGDSEVESTHSFHDACMPDL